jgi:hypothetical protein
MPNLLPYYINGKLKNRFGLDNSAKPKLVAGPDDLVRLLTYHWAYDMSIIFPTEDHRLDLATLMLFQSFTGCRPAELVDASKPKACLNPLAKLDEMDLNECSILDKMDEGDYKDIDKMDDNDYDSSSNMTDAASSLDNANSSDTAKLN